MEGGISEAGSLLGATRQAPLEAGGNHLDDLSNFAGGGPIVVLRWMELIVSSPIVLHYLKYFFVLGL